MWLAQQDKKPEPPSCSHSTDLKKVCECPILQARLDEIGRQLARPLLKKIFQVRDSKDRQGPKLHAVTGFWRPFLEASALPDMTKLLAAW
jgi:hypothetical protein